jgi:hypothetical protein
MPRKLKTYTVTILGSTQMNNQDHLILLDKTGFETFMPASLVKDNELIIEDNNKLKVTEGLYEMWFSNIKEVKLNTNSSILYNNFKKIYENKDLIINNKGYFQITPTFLYSGGLFFGKRSYSLGSLFEEWESNGLLKKENGWMFKISGSMLSGMNIYHSININDGTITEGSIYSSGNENWRKYLQIFDKLSNKRKNGFNEDLKYSNKLIKELNLT